MRLQMNELEPALKTRLPLKAYKNIKVEVVKRSRGSKLIIQISKNDSEGVSARAKSHGDRNDCLLIKGVWIAVNLDRV